MGLATLAEAQVALTPPPARPQNQPRVRRPGRFKIGPLRLTPRFELRNAGVDTNVFNRQSRPVTDTAVIFRPSLEVASFLGRRVRLQGEGHLDLNYYRVQKSARSVDFGGDGLVELDLSRFTFFAGGGGAQGRQRFTIDIDERLLRQERWVLAGATVGLGRRVWLTASAGEHVYRFGRSLGGELSIAESLDRAQRIGQVQGRLALTRQTTLIGSFELIEDLFLRQLEGARTAHSRRYLGGIEFGERALVTGRVLAGMREFPTSRPGGVPSYRGPVVSASTVLPLPGANRLSVQADRDVLYAAIASGGAEGRSRNTYVRTRLGAHAALALPFDLIGRPFVAVEQARYVLPYPRGRSVAWRADQAWLAGGSLLYPVSDWLRLGATAAYVQRRSNFEGLSYRAWRYGLQGELRP